MQNSAGNPGLVDDRAVSTPSIRTACSWDIPLMSGTLAFDCSHIWRTDDS
ncbi:MAG: hypothetical protein ACOCSQ_01245 [Planctomycetota bacterium]